MSGEAVRRNWAKQIWQILRVMVLLSTIFVCAICLALFTLVTGLDAPAFERGSQRAGQVIVALERYRQGWGKHPQALQQLVPDFLPAVPKVGWRHQYQYRRCEKAGVGYILYFMARDGRHCGFISKRAEWLCGDYDSSIPFHGETPCSN